MNAGYVRLSKDDDKRGDASIENQKLVIRQYAAEHQIVIDRWYEDDGISGYIFDRPGFRQLLADLETEIDAVYVKDFSRLGRHNARILLLLDEFQERGKRLVVIDDNYDNADCDDDIIGIKTWFNERYVKDVSKKIRRVIGAKQKDGSLATLPPFGYRRTGGRNGGLEIVPQESAVIRDLFSLYIRGLGYRKLAAYLTRNQIPTPSMVQRERALSDGKISRRRTAAAWSEGMVREILGNDFYTGVCRLHKRARPTVHGKDLRVPRQEQICFENHHPPIIDQATYNLVQEIKTKRTKSGYKGSHGPGTASANPSPFGSCLFCKDCGHKMTPVHRRQNGSIKNYYICSLYNAKGREFCAGSHLIEEEQLTDHLLHYLSACKDALRPALSEMDLPKTPDGLQTPRKKNPGVPEQIRQAEKQLNVLTAQKVRDIALHPDAAEFLAQSYDAVQQELSERLLELKRRLEEDRLEQDRTEDRQESFSAFDRIDAWIAGGRIGRAEMEMLVERIEVDASGSTEIRLKYGLSGSVRPAVVREMSQRLDRILLAALESIRDDPRGYTSARALGSRLAEKGITLSRQGIAVLLSSFIEAGLLERSGDKRTPYRILMRPEELGEWIRQNSENFPAAINVISHNRRSAGRYAGDGF